MPHGIVFLYSISGGIIQCKVYNSRPNRNDIIKDWKGQYAVKFLDCFIQIAPDTVDTSVDKLTGENTYKTHFKADAQISLRK